ncbi:MAG: hypothetical protein ACOCVE_02000 [Desulfovermiculus sp.]
MHCAYSVLIYALIHSKNLAAHSSQGKLKRSTIQGFLVLLLIASNLSTLSYIFSLDSGFRRNDGGDT